MIKDLNALVRLEATEEVLLAFERVQARTEEVLLAFERVQARTEEVLLALSECRREHKKSSSP